ncbi:MAG TPA: condensation domain-containing protein, partial [Terriglobales bacterium]|nr:condensation domain-containing protein [Terriglobales bacterium]
MPSLNELNDIGSDKPSAIAEEVFVFPASFAQQRLWFLDKLEPGQNTYNVPFAIRLNGNLNQQALERTLQEIVNRHEVLRTTFSEDEAGKPIQLVAPEQKFMLAVSDLRSFPAESREQEARRHVVEHVRQPFDLKRGPLFRASLFQLADAECILSLSFHHIIVDGWSWGVVLHELSALYEAFSQGKDSPLAPLSIQYGDYATWQHDWLQGERIDNLLAYWKKQLSDAPPVLELPGDFPRPLVQTFSGAQESTMVPRSLQDALTELSQKEGVTLFMTLLSAFDLLLARYSGQNDIVVGTPISGRTRAELEGL